MMYESQQRIKNRLMNLTQPLREYKYKQDWSIHSKDLFNNIFAIYFFKKRDERRGEMIITTISMN